MRGQRTTPATPSLRLTRPLARRVNGLRRAAAAGLALLALGTAACSSPVAGQNVPPVPAGTTVGAAPATPAAVESPAPTLSLGRGFVPFPGGAQQWVAAHPNDPRTPALRRALGGTASALWLTGDESFGNLREYVRLARARKGTMVLTSYNIPLRWDGLSTPSSVTGAQYAAWISRVARTIGSTRALLVLEPDALWFLDRLPDAAARTERLAALSNAVTTLRRYAPNTRVYLEAGTASGSVTPERMATLLRAAGSDRAAGFAVNVSSYAPTTRISAYADRIRAELRRQGVDNPRYVVDTGRNGASRWDNTWCNPTGQRLGARPSLVASRSGLDFRLWVKEPGTSDGDCGPTGAGKGSYGGEFLPAVAYRMIS